MSVLEIVRWPDARLEARCDAVTQITPAVKRLAQDMLETMYDAGGRGLAAPQVGVLCRMFVMDTAWKEGGAVPEVFINPHVISRSAVTVSQDEGCLSIPGIVAGVTRPEEVKMRWTNLSGIVQEQDFTGFRATCVQHELDHLDGIVTLDRLDAVGRARALKAYSAVPA